MNLGLYNEVNWVQTRPLYVASCSWKSKQEWNDVGCPFLRCHWNKYRQSLATASENNLRFTSLCVTKITSQPAQHQSPKQISMRQPCQGLLGVTPAGSRAAWRDARQAANAHVSCSVLAWAYFGTTFGLMLSISVVIVKHNLAEMQKFCNHLVSLWNSCEILPGWQEENNFSVQRLKHLHDT